jgi:hypothetical protein
VLEPAPDPEETPVTAVVSEEAPVTEWWLGKSPVTAVVSEEAPAVE